ncbi:hypothetical protein G5714_013936 [Onychostoma macrolepis]|uniref:Ig-like domain-containing protein n=1 Tax=Onychostoma macrolepis TaxID=369639 RepID=A0A7J6CD89_9TELE|nr:hypothetical protein G5714_013936 [Onychostoma macrolepis]
MMLIFGLMLLLQTAASPIGSVEVSIICSSNQRSVSCFTKEGDQIKYNWTLNGDPLMDGNSSIDLDERTDGNISCSVKNHVSHAQKTIRLKPCPDVSLIALGCAALILILLFITVCYVYKKKQLKSTPAAAGDTELIYSDVYFKKKDEKKNTDSLPAADVEYAAVRRQTKRKKEEEEEEEDEVQYGEVTFTPNHSNAPENEM